MARNIWISLCDSTGGCGTATRFRHIERIAARQRRWLITDLVVAGSITAALLAIVTAWAL